MTEKNNQDWKVNGYVGKVRKGMYGQILAFSPQDVNKLVAFIKENESWVSVGLNHGKNGEPYMKILPPMPKDDTSYKKNVKAASDALLEDDLPF